VTALAQRWWKFSLVGALGIGVQIAAFALYSRFAGLDYRVVTALAVETAILHNFAWHERFTWRGLPRDGAFKRLLKFHAGNGLISIAGNVAIVTLLSGIFRIPGLIATGAAIATCALANFAVSEYVVFRR
jgi:putative flippase GtrA